MLPYCLTIFICVSLTDETDGQRYYLNDTTGSEKSGSEPTVSAPVPVRDTSYDSSICEVDMLSMQSGNWLTDNAVHVGMQGYIDKLCLLDDGVSQVVAGP